MQPTRLLPIWKLILPTVVYGLAHYVIASLAKYRVAVKMKSDLQNSKVGALPVVEEDGRLSGILSVRDLLRAFINVLGIGEPGTLLCILVEEKVGQLKKIVDAVTEENISFGSVLVARYWDENKRAVFTYLLTLNVAKIKRKLADLGFTLLDPMEWYLDQLPKNELPPQSAE